MDIQVDGQWRRVMQIPGVAGLPLVNRLKLMADLEPTTQRRPHQGEIHAIVDGKTVIQPRSTRNPVTRR
jgi:type II secretory ATPase GspE/PulE/Tfp pilus assembly ATPase PilB-like protein